MDAARFLMACVLAAAVLSGCTTTVRPPSSSLGKVSTAETPAANSPFEQAENGAGLGSSQTSHDAEMAIEDEISTKCVAAWRTGLAGNLKEAMAQLDALAQKYPQVPTILAMQGQLLDHFGKKQEAIKYYQKAAVGREFSTLNVFKLAEDLRATKQDKEAIVYYRRLLQCDPKYVPGKIGLAKTLLDMDKSSAEAKKELEGALAIEPDNKDAQALLHGITN
ncbi:MAG TPA: tetratricopeptide repeat protein [Trichormus sp.]